MAFVSKEEIEKAREIDLVSFLKAHNPSELIPDGSNAFRSKTHSSLTMSNGKWCWFGGGKIGGSNALDYLMKVEQVPFPEAVQLINSTQGYVPQVQAKETEPISFSLPIRNPNNKRVTAYLLSRGIDMEIIDYCYQNKLLYEDADHHNAVFVGYDENTPKYASLRGATTGNKFKGEVCGSDKAYSFSLPAQITNSTLHVFESAIDALSFLTLVKLSGKDWRKESVLSLGGVAVKRTERQISIPVALEQYLSVHKNVTEIILRLDNDKVGREAAEAIKITIEEINVSIEQPPKGKDYNELLMLKKGIAPPRKQASERER